MIRFDRLLLDAMFGATIGEAVEPVVGLVVASCVLLVFRSYYFGQVLYLTRDPHLLTRSNGVHCAVMVVLGLALTPWLGMAGVALALMLAHIGGCLVFVLAWRGTFALRLPFGRALGIVVIAGAVLALTGTIEQNVTGRWAAAAVNTTILAAALIIAARLYNLLSFNDLLVEAWRIVRLKIQRHSS